MQGSYTDHHKWYLCNTHTDCLWLWHDISVNTHTDCLWLWQSSYISVLTNDFTLTEKLPLSPSTEVLISVIDWCLLWIKRKKLHMNIKNFIHGEPVLTICWTMSMTITHSAFHLSPFLMSAEDCVEGWPISWKFLSHDMVWLTAVVANFTSTWFYSSVNEPVFLAGNGKVRYQ
jgi:hypothetical protein